MINIILFDKLLYRWLGTQLGLKKKRSHVHWPGSRITYMTFFLNLFYIRKQLTN